jgi:hypothetical protein
MLQHLKTLSIDLTLHSLHIQQVSKQVYLHQFYELPMLVPCADLILHWIGIKSVSDCEQLGLLLKGLGPMMTKGSQLYSHVSLSCHSLEKTQSQHLPGGRL